MVSRIGRRLGKRLDDGGVGRQVGAADAEINDLLPRCRALGQFAELGAEVVFFYFTEAGGGGRG
ncbi:MAG: hypothetical protein WBA17_04200 [Saprospiraceae bacterium]